MRQDWLWVIGIDLVAVVLSSVWMPGLVPLELLWGAVVAGATTWAELNPLNLNEDGDLTVSELAQIAALVSVGPRPVLLGILIGEIAWGIIDRRPLIKICFNAGQTIICVAAAQWVFLRTGGTSGVLSVHSLALALTYVLVNTLLVARILSVVHQQRMWPTWLDLNRGTISYSLILASSGLAFGGLILSYQWLGGLLAGVMVLCLHAVLSQATVSLKTLRENLTKTVMVLMTALEYRDPSTYGHSSRVSLWCRKIALEMALSPAQVDVIELGGLLHDVGKVGVPDNVLNKLGPLSCAEEFEQIKAHPLIGERIILGMVGMNGVEQLAAMARQHHVFFNRSDRGYPEHPLGEELFLGSRILSIADAWDAMTADRPYRRALSAEEAVARLKAGRGEQFDPTILDLFLQILERDGIRWRLCG